MASKTGRPATGATYAIKILWEENFFVAWKKKAPIEEVLAKRGNHFSDAELGMALKRATHLTRRGKRGSTAGCKIREGSCPETLEASTIF
jgi:hypothetical protein